MFAARNMLFAKSGVSYDSDATTYFAAIVTAGSTISDTNKAAVNAFVVGCKADGIWTAIKASCLLCAADDLTGALVPLVGAAPTNVNFVSGDYSRTTGLIGNGSTKYLDSNRAGNTDPQDNYHASAFVTGAGTIGRFIMGSGANAAGATTIGSSGSTRSRESNFDAATAIPASGHLFGVSRSATASYSRITNGSVATITRSSTAPNAADFFVFESSTVSAVDTCRLSFYSIGESLDLALLDTRLTTLMAAIT